MTDDWVTVAESSSLIELQDLCARLRDRGLHAEIPEQLGAAMGMTDVYGFRRRYTLRVPKSQETQALDLLRESESQASSESSAPRTASTWPVCPECGKPRLAVCPYCETAGSEFLMPDAVAPEEFETTEEPKEACGNEKCGCSTQTSDVIARRPDPTADDGAGYVEGAPELVICPSCDEPFRPRMANRCAWCDYTFPDGIPVSPEQLHDTAGTTPAEIEPSLPMWKIVAAIILLGLILSVLLTAFVNV
ncbi:MAG: hypothetical protein D6741_07975 [Planctomycetota bacterium]|nr:MAG: hypothetical protein D6741_07975 [Planctomycetota bacterium]